MNIKKTALYERHVALGAHMVEFKNTWLPVRFKSEIEEHAGVRNSVGIFDVSHMGEFFVEGPHAQGFLQRLLTNNIERLNVGNAHYSLMLNDNGGIIDDLIVYRLDEERYLLCVNAGNIDRDWHHVREQALRYEPCTITNASNNYAQLALQGPKSAALLSKLCYDALPSRFDIKTMNIAGITALVARTGYCGTDGFEIFVSHMNATSLFDHLCTAGKSDLTLCGLAARDSLRLEAGLLLHGQDMDETTSPKEAGLLFAVDMNKEYFVGKDMLERRDVERKLVGFRITDRGIARHGFSVLDENLQSIGVVTSATYLADKKMAIGFAYVAIDKARKDTPLLIDIRGRPTSAVVCSTRFLLAK